MSVTYHIRHLYDIDVYLLTQCLLGWPVIYLLIRPSYIVPHDVNYFIPNINPYTY